MECDCNIHQILRDDITVVDSSFECLRHLPRLRHEKCRSELYSVIDKMGQLSARAQSLPAAITSGMKLAYSDHRLYILKETMPETRQVVGILKVGCKKLFVYDMHGVQHEVEPLCVLDFYVHESRQRQGCGRKLFDFMIQREGVIPRHLAIDRPSHKFSAFLEKHYELSHVIPQMNNFVVFQGFFRDRTDYPRGRRFRSALGGGDLARNNRSEGIPPQHNSANSVRRSPPSLPRLPSAKSNRHSLPPAIPVHQATSASEQKRNSDLVGNMKAMTLNDDPRPVGQPSERRGADAPMSPGQNCERRGVEDGLWSAMAKANPKEESLLRRNEAAKDILNGHQEYLTRDGRLRVGPANPRRVALSRREAQSAHYGSLGNMSAAGAASAASEEVASPNWTMYTGSNAYTYQQGLNRNYRHTRLW